MKLISKRQAFKELNSVITKPEIEDKRIGLTRMAQEALNKWETDSTQHNSKACYQVLDFFSGCGGMSLGFAALNKVVPSFKIVGGVDINAVSLSTFESNYGAPGVQADVRTLVKKKNLEKLLEKLPNYEKGKPTIVIGCAPCQGFSSHRKKHWDKEDGRNSLIGSFAKVAAMISPDCIVMENVPELLSKKYWHEFEMAKSILEKNDYVVKQAIYNCAEFGVPQERFRAIVIAMKKDFSLPVSLFKERSSFFTVRDAIGDLREVAAGVTDPVDKIHRSASHNPSTLATIKKIPLDGGNRPVGVGPKCLDKVKGFSDVYGRLYWDKPSITITHYARNPASGRFVHPVQNRGLTARESARLQSFPDGFVFQGKFDDIFRQIGEAVPPRFSASLAAQIFLELLIKSEVSEDQKQITTPVSNSYSSVIAGVKAKSRGEVHV